MAVSRRAEGRLGARRRWTVINCGDITSRRSIWLPPGVLADVPDQPDDPVGQETCDGTGGIHTDRHWVLSSPTLGVSAASVVRAATAASNPA